MPGLERVRVGQVEHQEQTQMYICRSIRVGRLKTSRWESRSSSSMPLPFTPSNRIPVQSDLGSLPFPGLPCAKFSWIHCAGEFLGNTSRADVNGRCTVVASPRVAAAVTQHLLILNHHHLLQTCQQFSPAIPTIASPEVMGFRSLFHRKPRVRPKIYFYEKHSPYYEFTNFSPHSVEYDGKRYPTSEHLFQSFKVSSGPALSTFTDTNPVTATVYP